MPWNGYGNLNDDQINSALANTGSNYKVYSGNPFDMRLSGQNGRTTPMTDDERRAYANMSGASGVAEQAYGGGGSGGQGMMGRMGGLGGMMGGGGGGIMGGGGGSHYQAPPVGETQAQTQEREFTMRRQAQANKVQNLAGILGKIFGF